MSTKDNYTAESFEHLAGPEQVRKRAGMYLGELGEAAVFTCLRELLDNVVDEALEGHTNLCEVIITKKDGFFVRDAGRGFPHGDALATNAIDGSKTKMPAFQLATGMIHGGAKMGGKSYTISRGVNGLGMTAANFMANEFDGWSYNSGEWHSIHYVKGILQRYVGRKQIKAGPKHPITGKPISKGTLFRFVPDKSVLHATKFDLSLLEQWAKDAAYFTPGLKVRAYLPNGEMQEWHSTNGTLDFVQDRLKELSATQLLPIVFSHSSALADVSMTFTDADDCALAAYANGLSNPDRGVHFNAVLSAVEEAVGAFKSSKDAFTSSELREGLLGVVNARLSEPKFSSQTKEKLVDARAGKPLHDELVPVLTKFFKTNKDLTKAIIERCNQLQGMRAKFVASKSLLKALKAVKKQGLPAKAVLSPKTHPDQRECFFVEGDSAAGPVELGRLPYQEVLPLKGKPQNAMRTSKKNPDAAITNEESLQMMTLIGYDPTKPDDFSKLRTKKIILLADPDPDGPLPPDTLVQILTEETKQVETHTIEHLHNMFQAGGRFSVVSLNADGTRKWSPVCATWAYMLPHKAKIVQVKFQDGSHQRSSLKHRWVVKRPLKYSERVLNSEGKTFNLGDKNAFGYCEAQHLKAGDQVAQVWDEKGAPATHALTALLPSSTTNWLTIAKTQEIKYNTDDNTPEYFCLSVEGNENFLLTSGVITGNCHINSLLLALFGRYGLPLLKAGYVYVVEAPEFYAVPASGKHKGETVMGATRQEIAAKLGKMGCPASTVVSHLKGWGEKLSFGSLLQTSSGFMSLGELVANHEDDDIEVGVAGGAAAPEGFHSYRPGKVRSVKTLHGVGLRPSDNHPILVLDSVECRLRWKKAIDVVPGDFMALSRTQDAWTEQRVRFDDYSSVDLVRSTTTQHVSYPDELAVGIPELLAPSLARLMGYWAADGSGDGATLHCGPDQDYAEDAARLYEKHFPGVATSTRYLGNDPQPTNMWEVRVTRGAVAVKRFWSHLGMGGKTAYTKTVPDCVMASPKKVVAQFLRGLFEGDGYANDLTIEWYSASNTMARQVTVILQAMGVVAKLAHSPTRYNPFTGRVDEIPANKLTIQGTFIDVFNQQVGFFSERKRSAFGKRHYSNGDCIPGFKKRLQALRAGATRKGAPSPGLRGYHVRGEVVWTALGAMDVAKEMTYHQLDAAPELKQNLHLVDKELADVMDYCLATRPFWTEVVSNTVLEKKYLCGDLTLPESNTPFVGSSYVADGYVVHNCDVETFQQIALNPETRVMTKIVLTDEGYATLKSIMGDSVESRRTLLGVE